MREIGYIVDAPAPFAISTQNIDPEIASVAGPQLVVPASNARFALNAANARWGSLYDALYGTDAIMPAPTAAESAPNYDKARGDQVIDWARRFLDGVFSLSEKHHRDADAYAIVDGQLRARIDGQFYPLMDPTQFVGFAGSADAPSAILLQHNGLRVEISIDPTGQIGANDKAGVNDITLESAITTIVDCEDSVATVDGDDKAQVYQNWLGLMRRDLQTHFTKGDKTITRALNPARQYTAPDGSDFELSGQSLMLVRNVGLHMMTDAVLYKDQLVFEGILDALITAAIAVQDVNTFRKNSPAGSVYIVKPKMHGPEEVAFTVTVFSAVEEILNLPENTLKIGIMDEERRTSVNLAACIFEAKDRLAFINTGFLDRTGDEIFTLKNAGPFLPKGEIKGTEWISAYEQRNVTIGLASGLKGKAQIGKGMWAKPDAMKDMLLSKGAHLLAGANCAWVPSPTAATLHAMHYHEYSVADIQDSLAHEPIAPDDALLGLALCDPETLTTEAVQAELDNNIQGLLGYVVKWVNQGIGCSKVPDMNDEGLMEDRATLRISSQHLANWLLHGVCSEAQILETMTRMAAIVDGQNAGDRNYVSFGDNLDESIAFATCKSLIFEAHDQPNGYTEFILTRGRKAFKAHTST